MRPRYGSYADYHPPVERSLSIRHQVVGNNGQRRAMFLELDFVFRHDDGTPYHHEKVRIALSRALARAGLPQILVHDLRHTYATLMLEQGDSGPQGCASAWPLEPEYHECRV